MKRSATTLYIPGNLLLAGEFALLKEGGRGIGFAVNRHARAEIVPSHEFRLAGKSRERRFKWPGDTFLEGLVDSLASGKGGYPKVDIRIDTDAFFESSERKRGFGSSAVTALAAAYGFLYGDGSGDFHRRTLFDVSLKAYRSAQGGPASGYDLAASLYGGAILYSGGAEPGIQRLELPWFPDSFDLKFPGAGVSSPKWGKRFFDLPESDKMEWVSFSNKRIGRLIEAESSLEAGRILRTYSEHSRRLQRTLGLDMMPTGQEPPGNLPEKYLGAGGEVLWSVSPAGNERDYKMDREGLRW